MNNSIKKGVVVAVILLFVSVSAIPSTGTTVEKKSTIPTFYDGSLSGYVNDTFNNPIAGARVRVYFHETYEENYTDSSGYYNVNNIPICYCLKNCTASKNGYKTEWVWLSIGENTTYDFVLTPIDPHCYPVFNGTMGENGWYVSCVEINFTTDDNVSTVYYSIDNGSWQTFDGVPIVVCDDGLHIFCWYYVDNEGNESAIECIEFKIDQTDPFTHIIIERKNWFNYLLHASIDEFTSGVQNVEFYYQSELVNIDYDEPYECEIGATPKGPCSVRGVIFLPQISDEYVTFYALLVVMNWEYGSTFTGLTYDKAGNSASDTIATYLSPYMGICQHFTFPNNYTGDIAFFRINANFEEGPL